jgi:hypothetical protein
MNPRTLRPAAPSGPKFTPQGYARLWAVTQQSTGDISGSAESDTGYYAVKWWDDTVDEYESGDPFSKPATGGKRAFDVYPIVGRETSLLLHFDGANESTTFTDSSPNELTVTPSGEAEISTDESKFGGASAYFIADESTYLTVSQSEALDVTAGDFTIELWMYWIDGNAIFNFAGDYGMGLQLNVGEATGDKLAFHASSNGSSWNMFSSNPGEPPGVSSIAAPRNQWCHIAVTRQGSVYKAFINGAEAWSGASAATPTPLDERDLLIGRWIPGIPEWDFEGYIDDFRITKGVALYTSNFTLPSAALASWAYGTVPYGQFDGFDLSGNALTQVRSEGVSLFGVDYAPGFFTPAPTYSNPYNSAWVPAVAAFYEGGRVMDNLLSSEALDQFYADLESGGGRLFVSGNPGIADDDPTIATAKGYTVFGSVPPSTALLLHFDGADGSTTFTDFSPNALPFAAGGGAEISTAESKFGGASLALGGSAFVSTTAPITLGAGSFTIEAWVFVDSESSGTRPIASAYDLAPTPTPFAKWLFYVTGDGTLSFLAENAGQNQWTLLSGGAGVPTDEWVHVAVTRSNDSLRLFVDGVENTHSVSNAGLNIPSADITAVGKLVENGAGADHFAGYIDELRILIDTAVYTANFTPPTGPLSVYP